MKLQMFHFQVMINFLLLQVLYNIIHLASNNNLIIWNCSDFTVVHNKLLEVPINLITWCPPRRSSTKHS